MKIKGKVSVGRTYGHGESWETVDVSFQIPDDWWAPNAKGYVLSEKAKRLIREGKVTAHVEVEE